MSRNIDFSNPLSEEDAEYVRQRDWMVRDAELSGFEVIWPGEDAEESEKTTSTDETGTETGAAAEEEETEEVDYNDLTVSDLQEEIAARNEERDEDDQIEVDSKAKKADLITALEADDQAQAEEETSE